jgi:hypothetical protein
LHTAGGLDCAHVFFSAAAQSSLPKPFRAQLQIGALEITVWGGAGTAASAGAGAGVAAVVLSVADAGAAGSVVLAAGVSAVALPGAVGSVVVAFAGGVASVTAEQSVPMLVPVPSMPVRAAGAVPQMAVLPLRLLVQSNKAQASRRVGSNEG